MWSTQYLDAPDFLGVELFDGQPEKTLQNGIKNLSSQENSWIDQYLDREFFKEKENSNPSQEVSAMSTSETLPRLTVTLPAQTLEGGTSEGECGKRSIFHNIQKNLITFLRKINIRWKDLVHEPCGLRAYDLWKLFLTGKVFTKQCLYMVYGVAQHQNQQYMLKLSNSNPQLKKLVTKYPFEEIEKAQDLLRRKTFLELSHMQKDVMKKLCKMSNFDHFYTFLQSFMEELRQPGLTLRMKRIHKPKIIPSDVSSSREDSATQ